MISLLHTPDGVRDLYGEELTQKKQLLKSINNTIKLYGFEMLDTPAFEYFDVLIYTRIIFLYYLFFY